MTSFNAGSFRWRGNESTPGYRYRSRDLSDETDLDIVTSVKHNEKVDVRLPSALRSALEQERRRMSKTIGAEVKTSAVIRAILEQKLLPKRAARRAA